MIRRYPSVIDVIAAHDFQIEKFGGASGLRDRGALEAAIFRPQSGYYDDLIAEAAALWESLSQNHPFVDGNKRTAKVAVYGFLKTNGLRVTASDAELELFLRGLYDGAGLTFSDIDPWLRENTETLK